jgi:hypothetical protein
MEDEMGEASSTYGREKHILEGQKLLERQY